MTLPPGAWTRRSASARVDLEVGKRDGVARTRSSGVPLDRGRAPAELPALALSFDPLSPLHAEEAAPEAKRPFGLVGGELNQSQRRTLNDRNIARGLLRPGPLWPAPVVPQTLHWTRRGSPVRPGADAFFP
jgi:hypothetical protein